MISDNLWSLPFTYKKAYNGPLLLASYHLGMLPNCRLLDALLDLESSLESNGIPASILAASKQSCVEEGGHSLSFLSLVVLPLLDVNQDDVIDRDELLSLQVLVV